jgi:hypothetical protein
MRRNLSAQENRSLQSGGVKIDFVLGLSSSSRAAQAQTGLTDLSSGKATTLMQFVVQLDVELTQRGKAPVRLDSSAVAFTKPSVQTLPTPQNSGTSGQLWSFNSAPTQNSYQQGNTAFYNQGNADQGSTTTVIDGKKDSGSGTTMMLIVGGVLLVGCIAYLAYNNGKQQSIKEQPAQQSAQDLYSSKVAEWDNQWTQDSPAEANQANW